MDKSEKMVTSDDNDSSSSSDDEEKELENQAAILERQLTDNKYLYEDHLQVIEVYRKLGDLKSMRAAYERFSQYFPLTSSIWLSWLKEEIKLANSSAEKKNILTLFDKAVEDYQSIDVWLEYVQFCIGSCEPEDIHKVLERGLNTVGLNAKHGSLLWDALRELELARLAVHEPLSEEWHKQAANVADAFRRQLSVPLLGMESTYNEWQEWLPQLPADHKIDPKLVEWGYQKALKVLNDYKPFEEQLLVAKEDDEVFNIYRNYIKVVTDPSTVLCLYERAVAQLSLNTELWTEYCSYTLKLGGICHSTSKRALRNCPWSEELWMVHMRILEQQKFPSADVMQCLEQGLNAIVPSPGLNLWLSYLEYNRRSEAESKHLHKIFTQAAKQLGEDGDPSCKILRLQARIYAREGDMQQARKVWSRILHFPGHNGTATAWLEFVALEKQYGEASQARTIYQNAISSCKDWPQYIVEDWLMYERECGSLENMLKCLEVCSHVTSGGQEIPVERHERNYESRKRSHESNGRISKGKRYKTEKSEQPPPRKKVAVSNIDSEKSVFVSNMREDVNEDKLQEVFPNATAICIPTDKTGSSRCYAYVQFAGETEVEQALTRDREPLDGRPLFISKCQLDQAERKRVFKYPTHGEENKLFVRGLPVDFTQEDVEGIFKPHGAVAVRLVMHRSGRSKGLAYVEFPDEEKTKSALAVTDQLNVGGHTITVAVSAPPPKKNPPAHMGPSANSAPIRHARSRLQVPLIPRALVSKNSDSAAQGPSKSNDDFRKMLFKKS